MELTGSYTFAAEPARVWTLLMDPVTLASCIPGCSSLDPDGENRYRAKLAVAMSAIAGTFDATVQLADVAPLNSYRLIVEGQGRPGFAKGDALITLQPDGTNTIVTVAGTMQAGGPIARMGQRLIGSVAKSMQDRFFACLQGKV